MSSSYHTDLGKHEISGVIYGIDFEGDAYITHRSEPWDFKDLIVRHVDGSLHPDRSVDVEDWRDEFMQPRHMDTRLQLLNETHGDFDAALKLFSQRYLWLGQLLGPDGSGVYDRVMRRGPGAPSLMGLASEHKSISTEEWRSYVVEKGILRKSLVAGEAVVKEPSGGYLVPPEFAKELLEEHVSHRSAPVGVALDGSHVLVGGISEFDMPKRLTHGHMIATFEKNMAGMHFTRWGLGMAMTDFPSLPDDPRWGECQAIAVRRNKDQELVEVRFSWTGGEFLKLSGDMLKEILDPRWAVLEDDVLTLWGVQLALLMHYEATDLWIARRMTPFDGFLVSKDYPKKETPNERYALTVGPVGPARYRATVRPIRMGPDGGLY